MTRITSAVLSLVMCLASIACDGVGDAAEAFSDKLHQGMCETGGCAAGYGCVHGRCVQECEYGEDCESGCCFNVDQGGQPYCVESADPICQAYLSSQP